MRESNQLGGIRVLYLTTEYPHVSHTFIRREILGLESMGIVLLRVAIRRSGALADNVDLEEQAQTIHLLAQPKGKLLSQIFLGIRLSARSLPKAISRMWRFKRNSDRGLFRHLAYLGEALAIRAIAHKNRIGHIHVHFGTNAATVAMLSNVLGGPGFSATIHGPDEFDAVFGFSLADKLMAAEFVCAISWFCLSQLQRWLPHEHWSKLHIVRCTVDDTWLEQDTPLEEDNLDLVCVGRFSEQKGHFQLIAAFSEAVKRGYPGNLRLVGDGALRDAIQKMAEYEGISNRVVFFGWCDAKQIQRHLAESRALVLASFAEGLPVVIMEALAMRRPVIATCIMGVPELVRHGEEGWLVTPGDAESLCEAMLDLASCSLEELRRRGQSGHDRVRANHSLQSQLPRLVELLDAAGSAKGRRPSYPDVAHRSNTLF